MDPIDTAQLCALSASNPEVGFQPGTDLSAGNQIIRNLNGCCTSLRQGQSKRSEGRLFHSRCFRHRNSPRKSVVHSVRINGGFVPSPEISTPDPCCGPHQWPLFSLRDGMVVFAHAAFLMLRARAARNSNSQVGLRPAVRRCAASSRSEQISGQFSLLSIAASIISLICSGIKSS
jgi:hypothetical protein